MTIPIPTEFWNFNNTREGVVAGMTPVWSDALEHYVDPGKIGQGAGFQVYPGNFKYLTLNPSPGINPGNADFTWSCWFKPNVLNNTQRLISMRDGTQIKFFIERGILNTPGVSFLSHGTLTGERDDWNDLNWHHVAATYSSVFDPTGADPQVKLYFDGIFWKGGYYPVQVTFPTFASPNLILAGGPLTSLDGVLDCVGYWSRVLSAGEVAEVFNAGAGWEYSPPPATTDIEIVVGPQGKVIVTSGEATSISVGGNAIYP